MIRAALATCFVAIASTPAIRAPLRQPTEAGLYDLDPNHLWNRIHETFHVRIAADGARGGFDRVDPLLWRETRYLLAPPSHGRAIDQLDEFLASNAERLIRDPLKHAVFQHDLWAVFDWLESGSDRNTAARTALEQRVARVMRRVALSRKEIQALPDNYAAAIAAGAPPDLFSRDGGWVAVGGTQPIAAQHANELGRSAFIVLWNVPGGATKTTAYLRKLWEFPQPFVADESFEMARDGELRATLNPALPAVPDGTRIALVRKMLLIDESGAIVPSNLVETIQLRTVPGRAFSEMNFSRVGLFTGLGAMRAVAADDRDFLTFSSHGDDPFERASDVATAGLPRTLDMCPTCHQIEFRPAIETLLSLRRVLKPGGLVDSRHDRWAVWFTQSAVAAEAKSRTREWGVLEGLWQALPR